MRLKEKCQFYLLWLLQNKSVLDSLKGDPLWRKKLNGYNISTFQPFKEILWNFDSNNNASTPLMGDYNYDLIGWMNQKILLFVLC